MSTTRAIIGGILIILGIIYLTNNLNIIHFNLLYYIFSLPGLLIFIGLIKVINSRRKGLGIVLITIGTLWMLSRLFPFINFWDYFWGVILFLLGIHILLRPHRRWRIDSYDIFGRTDRIINNDKIDDVSIFSGCNKVLSSNNFQGGNIVSIFGGSKIDLTNCKLAPGDNVIDVLIIFGGTEIIVPKDWTIVVDVFPIFGGFSNKTMRDTSQVYDQSKKLILKGVVIFGGGELKDFKMFHY
jgi:predicted membrane protein